MKWLALAGEECFVIYCEVVSGEYRRKHTLQGSVAPVTTARTVICTRHVPQQLWQHWTTGTETDRQTDRQAERQTDRQTDRQLLYSVALFDIMNEAPLFSGKECFLLLLMRDRHITG